MKEVWHVGGGQVQHGGEGHPVPEDHTTSNVTYYPSRGPAPEIRWVCGGGRRVLGEQVLVVIVVVADPGAEYHWEEADRDVATRAEWVVWHHRSFLTWKVWKTAVEFADRDRVETKNQWEG